MMRGARLLPLASLLLAPGYALGESSGGRPAITPLRDVDVTYAVARAVPDAPPVTQRMRWSVATGRLRVDPPTPGLYMIVDYRTRRMAVVRPEARAVLDMSGAGPGLPGSPAGAYVAEGTAEVAGLACTQWQTADAAGKDTLLCLTADGVMLQASQEGRVLLQAVSVTYGPQDPAAFVPPDGYTHIAGPVGRPVGGR